MSVCIIFTITTVWGIVILTGDLMLLNRTSKLTVKLNYKETNTLRWFWTSSTGENKRISPDRLFQGKMSHQIFCNASLRQAGAARRWLPHLLGDLLLLLTPSKEAVATLLQQEVGRWGGHSPPGLSRSSGVKQTVGGTRGRDTGSHL